MNFGRLLGTEMVKQLQDTLWWLHVWLWIGFLNYSRMFVSYMSVQEVILGSGTLTGMKS